MVKSQSLFGLCGGLIFLLIITLGTSCGRKMTGDSAFKKKLYSKAIKLYSKDLESVSGDTASAEIAFKIAV
jgi:hypothetical protein